MAISAKEIKRSRFIRVLIMGPPKVGKSSCVIATSPGPVHVLNCEPDDEALNFAAVLTDGEFTFDRCHKGWNAMQAAVLETRKRVDKGEVKTVVLDPLSTFGAKLEKQCLDETDKGSGPDGRRAYPAFNRRMEQLLDQLFAMKCHIVVISHYVDVGGGEVQPDDGGEATPRVGEGYMPLLPGKARALVPAKFPNIVWMDYYKGRRVFVTGPRGAWGPGCRGLNETKTLPADVHSGKKYIGIAALIRAFKKAALKAGKRSARREDE